MRRLVKSHTGQSRAPLAGISAWLEANPERNTVATFSPLPGEPDLTELIRSHPGRVWVYPKVRGHDLRFHIVRDPSTDLGTGAFGILEPADRLPLVDAASIDAFLCPGLAFDENGGRLGRGRGFYDRALSLARPDAIRIGVCHPYQIVPDTHCEPHDIRMHLVLGRSLTPSPAPRGGIPGCA